MRHAAFLRGVSPLSLKMADLARVLDGCGFTGVRTLLSSGNAVFDVPRGRRDALEARIEAALQAQMGRAFATFVRSADEVGAIASRAGDAHPAATKPIVVLLRGVPAQTVALPVRGRSFALTEVHGTEAYGYYTPGRDASAFMALLERTFGAVITTRTVQTVRTCAKACHVPQNEPMP